MSFTQMFREHLKVSDLILMTTVQCKPSKVQVPRETIVYIFTKQKDWLVLVTGCVVRRCGKMRLQTQCLAEDRDNRRGKKKKNSPLGNKFKRGLVSPEKVNISVAQGGVAKPKKSSWLKLIKLLSKSFLLTRTD